VDYQLVAAAESYASSAVDGVMTYDDNVAMTTHVHSNSAENVDMTSIVLLLAESTNKTNSEAKVVNVALICHVIAGIALQRNRALPTTMRSHSR